MQTEIKILAALAGEKRLAILELLKDPEKNFPPQIDGDLLNDGVCGVNIAAKLNIAQPTVSRHLKQLVDARLLRATRIKQWTFYKRDEKGIREAKKRIRLAF